MDTLNQTLQALLAEACRQPPRSLARRQQLHQLHQQVMASGKLWKERTPYYNDALQEMWEFCCQHPDRYDPTRSTVLTWLDDMLKKRLRYWRDVAQRQQRREVAAPAAPEMPDPIAVLMSGPDIQPVLEMWEQTIAWVAADPTQQLGHTCFRNCPQINCQVLIQARLPPERSWEEIAAQFNLSPAAAKDLPKVYHRKCLPLLRQFAATQGYLDSPTRPPRRTS